MNSVDELHAALAAAVERRTYNRMAFFVPYPKQREFCNAGAQFRERLMMAANQVGKTEIGAYEAACHMTGDYPDWWEGRRFDHPTRGWAAGVTGLIVRDGPQRKLCGPPGVDADFGTGFIPKDRFSDKPALARGVANAYDMIQVEHRTNGKKDGISVCTFKSYEQGSGKFQSETLDWGWCDEEPPMDVYSEFLTRFTASGGMLFSTFTPLLGMSQVVMRFQPKNITPSQALFNMTIDDAEHMTPEHRAEVVAGYLPHEREARAKGWPLLGSGVVFQTLEGDVVEPTLEYIPPHWAKIWGIDFGIDHPFAAVLLLWDKDNDIIHVHHALRLSNSVPVMQAQAMRAIGAQVPVAWPHDGNDREKGSGEPLAGLYRREGLRMLAEHAKFQEGGISPEAGVLEIDTREKSGRWKIAAHLSEFLEERRQYHRVKGLLIKERDDLLSAARYGMMMKRFAQVVPLGSAARGSNHRETVIAHGLDFDVFAA